MSRNGATGIGTGFSVYMVSDANPLDTIQVRIDNDVNLFNETGAARPVRPDRYRRAI
jgi:hypothetical protein